MTPPIFVLDGVFFTVCCIVCYGRKNVRTVSAHFSLPYYTQSVVYLYTLCVYGYGVAFRHPVDSRAAEKGFNWFCAIPPPV